jgi:hypothetical protein
VVYTLSLSPTPLSAIIVVQFEGENAAAHVTRTAVEKVGKYLESIGY